MTVVRQSEQIPPLVGYQFDLDLVLHAAELRKQREQGAAT